MKKFSEILPSLKFSSDPVITDIFYDSRKVIKDSIFFAVPGFKEDGAKYLASAFANGASLAVVAKGAKIAPEFSSKCVEVADVRESLAEASSRFFGEPAKKLTILGITGTKGKTSTSYLLESVIAAAGRKTALLGTVECRHPGGSIPAVRTTLESYDLQKFLAEALKFGADAVVMEVSSHALSLKRVWGIPFAGVLFTNLSEDHMDFYHGMQDYFEAKKLLFLPPYTNAGTVGSVNLDNEYGIKLNKEASCKWITHGRSQGDLQVENLKMSDQGVSFTTKGKRKIDIQTSLAGDFVISNIMGVVALAIELGIPENAIQKGIASTKLPGRLERVATTLPFSVFVDFAHSEFSLENVLRSLRPFCKKKLWAVFGAGGDRDPARRKMGAVAARLADFTVITSDNPRTEDPQKIIQAVESFYLAEKGAKKDYVIHADRRQAIRYALENATAGDIICIAGKGHETGQTIGTQTFPFDDRIEAELVLRELENGKKIYT